MTEAPILATPYFTIPFPLETDALGMTMGVDLLQILHPIAYYNKAFCPRLQWVSTYVYGLQVITSAVCNGAITCWAIPSSSSKITAAWRIKCCRWSKPLDNKHIYPNCCVMIILSNTNLTPVTQSQTHCPEFWQPRTLSFSLYPHRTSHFWSSFASRSSMTPNIWNYCSKSTKTWHLNLNSPPTIISFSIRERFGCPLTTPYHPFPSICKECHL